MVQHAQVSVQQGPSLLGAKEYYMCIILAYRNWGNSSISFWSIPRAENSLYLRHTYFEYNHLVTKQLAVAYKTQKSWEWEVLFLSLVLVENYTSAEWNTVYYQLTGPAHLLQFVISLVSTEGEPSPHLPGSALGLAGGCWLSPGCGRDHLGWDKDQWPHLAHISGENASKHSWGWVKSVLGRAQRALSCPFHAGKDGKVKASHWSWRPIGKRLKRSIFFHKELFIYKAMGKTSSYPILPVRALHKCSESCTDILHIFSNCSKVTLPPRKAVMCPQSYLPWQK